MIDLHSHTYISDGELSPEELVDLAITKGVRAISVTDHDIVDGVSRAIKHAEGKDIEVVPGIEIRCYEPEKGFREIDVIGLFIDHTHEAIVDLTNKGKQERIDQKRKIIEKLQEFGLDITFDEVAKDVKGAFGRPHIAQYLMKKYPDRFSSIQDVFDQFIGYKKKAYVGRAQNLSIKEAVIAIKKAGGLSILAHPRAYSKEDSLSLIDLFVQAGGDGMETYYPYHLVFPQLNIDAQGNQELIQFYQEIAQKNNLVESGGCDFHGKKRDTIGKLHIPYEILENLKKKHKEKFNQGSQDL